MQSTFDPAWLGNPDGRVRQAANQRSTGVSGGASSDPGAAALAGGAAVVAAELCRRASCPVGCDRTWAAGAGMFSTTGMLFSGPGAAFAAELVEVEASRSTGASVRSMVVASSVRAGLPGDGGAVSASRSTVTSSEGTSTGRRCGRARPDLAFRTGGSSRVGHARNEGPGRQL